MGNTDSGEFGNAENEENNWFNNDGDSFTSRRTSRSRRETEEKPSHKESGAHSRSFSAAVVDRAQTPVSLVSPVMKINHQLRSHSARKATTPVSMVSPIINTTRQGYLKNHS